MTEENYNRKILEEYAKNFLKDPSNLNEIADIMNKNKSIITKILDLMLNEFKKENLSLFDMLQITSCLAAELTAAAHVNLLLFCKNDSEASHNKELNMLMESIHKQYLEIIEQAKQDDMLPKQAQST